MHLAHAADAPVGDEIGFDDFLKVDIRIGTVISAEELPKARNPAYKLLIDFGSAVGTKKSCAQIAAKYSIDELPGRQVAAVVNFPPRQIGPAMSEVLTLGFADEGAEVVLFAPDVAVPNGSRLF